MLSIYSTHRDFLGTTLVSMCLFTSALVAEWAAGADPAAQGLDIAKKVEKANQGFQSEESVMEMLLINATGETTTRRMNSKVFEILNDGDRSLIEFEWPADVKGTRMLTWSHKKGDDDQWMYLPAFKRVKRISSRNKTGSFMGSEFSYEDLGSTEPEKYRHRFIEEVEVEGRKVWVQEQVPVDPRSGYSKMKLWIDQQYMNPTKVEYYDRKGELLKTAAFKDYTQYGKLWRVGVIEMKNHQTKKASVLSWKNRTLKAGLDEDAFEQEELDS